MAKEGEERVVEAEEEVEEEDEAPDSKSHRALIVTMQGC